MKEVVLSITTDAGGDATVDAEGNVLGKLYAVEYQWGTLAATADLTLTCEGVVSKPILTITDAAQANAWYYPRDLVYAVANAAALTGTSGGDRAMPLLRGRPRVVVAQGGNAATGKLILYYED